MYGSRLEPDVALLENDDCNYNSEDLAEFLENLEFITASYLHTNAIKSVTTMFISFVNDEGVLFDI